MQLFYITKNHSHLEMILDAHTGQSTMATHAILPQANIAILSVKSKPQANKIRRKPLISPSHPVEPTYYGGSMIATMDRHLIFTALWQ